MHNADITSCPQKKSILPPARSISTSTTHTIQTIIRKHPWLWLTPKFVFQVEAGSRSGSRLLMSLTVQSEPCDYFGAKVQINPVQVTTSLIRTKCAALFKLCFKAYPAERLNASDSQCFLFHRGCPPKRFSSDQANNRTPHRPSFIHTKVVYTASLVRELSDRILDKYTNPYLSPTFWRLPLNVLRQMLL